MPLIAQLTAWSQAGLVPVIRYSFVVRPDRFELQLTKKPGACREKAIAGVDYVLHTASPFFQSTDESKLVKPAVTGTLNVLQACAAEGSKVRPVPPEIMPLMMRRGNAGPRNAGPRNA